MSTNIGERSQTTQDETRGIWTSMLASVARDNKITEKRLVVLGGNVETQKEFLQLMAQETQQGRKQYERIRTKKPPVASRFALGYTYQDVLDADQDDILARLSIYMLSNPDPAYASLLKPLFTSSTVQDTLVVVLLDWASPWTWLRQLRHWIQILTSVLDTLPHSCRSALEENMKNWRERRKGSHIKNPVEDTTNPSITIPLGPGEWDEGLGVPISVICTNAEHIGVFEREYGWKDDQFDFILQSLRTVILKHGGSLIYTESGSSTVLQALIRSTLDIRSLLQRDTLKHNVVDRSKVLVPPNWDSWGKIRVLGDEFDIEELSNLWSTDIHTAPNKLAVSTLDSQRKHDPLCEEEEPDAITNYEQFIRNPTRPKFYAFDRAASRAGNEVKCMDNQEFLAGQLQILLALKEEGALSQEEQTKSKPHISRTPSRFSGPTKPLSEHIGPVQLNMGGIHVNAEDMLRSLKDRETERSSGTDSSVTSTTDTKAENEKLRSFFAGLASRGSPSSTKGAK